MKGLLLKDFYSLRKDYISLVMSVAGVAAIMIFFVRDFFHPQVFVLLFSVLPMSLIIGSFNYDDKAGFMKYGLTTPVSRKGYLASKYVFQFIHSLTAAVLSAILLLVSAAASEEGITSRSFRRAAIFFAIVFIISNIICTAIISLTMKFEFARVRVIYTCSLLVCGALVGASMVITLSVPIAAKFIFSGLGMIVLGIAAWLFVMSFKWAQRKEF